jgi:two-component system chemotaxis response regulator CheB
MSLPQNDSSVVRVLVVDDSAFMRFTISKYFSESPFLQVVGTARDGQEALELIPKLNPDVVTLDVEMPRLDGLSTLREIMTHYPRPVVMLSSLTKEGAVETIQALTLGAVDFIAKPDLKANMGSILQEVVSKIIRASKAKVTALSRRVPVETKITANRDGKKKQIRPMLNSDRLVIIGSSTGGPRALNTVIPLLPADLQAAVMIIQHMPAGFTRSLAERLDNTSQLVVKEAEPGDTLMVGRILLAPGGFHMVFDKEGRVALNQNAPVHGVRPSVDVTMLSIVPQFGKRTIGAVLTGMGNDGASGASLIHGLGGWVIAESEETSIVWGMPRSVVEAGAANEVLPLEQVANGIVQAARR